MCGDVQLSDFLEPFGATYNVSDCVFNRRFTRVFCDVSCQDGLVNVNDVMTYAKCPGKNKKNPWRFGRNRSRLECRGKKDNVQVGSNRTARTRLPLCCLDAHLLTLILCVIHPGRRARASHPGSLSSTRQTCHTSARANELPRPSHFDPKRRAAGS